MLYLLELLLAFHAWYKEATQFTAQMIRKSKLLTIKIMMNINQYLCSMSRYKMAGDYKNFMTHYTLFETLSICTTNVDADPNEN